MQVARAYTPINDWKDPQDPHVRFLFRVYPEGVVSPWLANKQPGDRLEVCGPTLTWTYQTNTHETIDMIAGGTGVAVMHQILRRALNDPHDQTRFRLLYASSLPGASLALREELKELSKRHPDRLDIHYVLGQPPEPEDLGASNWTLSPILNPKLVESWLPPPSSKRKVLVCGPDGMMRAVCGERATVERQGPVTGILGGMGYGSKDVWKF
ncbi:MAG: hypothetical protein DHS80DRAFT_13235 [Piptocephalis tieghemiana]|nr:MAG: hypothetical protein DHS80DRAFT_13235 [Piptocephalis tieghemiana]